MFRIKGEFLINGYNFSVGISTLIEHNEKNRELQGR